MRPTTYVPDQRDATKAPPAELSPWSLLRLQRIADGRLKLDRSGPCPCGSKDCEEKSSH